MEEEPKVDAEGQSKVDSEEQPKVDAEEQPKDDDQAASSEEEEWVGPLPSEQQATEPQAKKRKVLNFEKLFLEK